MHIMVVNDSMEFLQLMEELLRDEGYQVTVVETGAGTRTAARHLRPDLIILDVRLPDMSGFEVLNLLRLDPETEAIPVLLCTAAVRDVQAQEEVLGQRGIPVLFKPFDLEALLTAIRQILRQ
jgi:putative two-component system response regulator